MRLAGIGTEDAVRRDGANEKLVTAGREIGKVEGALIRWRTPVVAGIELVLVAHRLASGKRQRDEIQLQMVSVGIEVGQRDVRLTEC